MGRRWQLGGIALYFEKRIKHEELFLKYSHKQVKSLLVKVRDQGNKRSLVVDIYYRLPDHAESIDEAFFLQLQQSLHSQALVLLEDF